MRTSRKQSTRRRARRHVPAWCALLGATVLGAAVACQTTPPTLSPAVSPLQPRATVETPDPTATPPERPIGQPLPSLEPDALRTTLAQAESFPPLDVVLVDRSGIVAAIEALPQLDQTRRDGISLAPPPGRGFVYTWHGGGCDAWTLLTAGSTPTGIQLDAVTEVAPGACHGPRPVRQLLIRTTRVVDPETVTVRLSAYVPEPTPTPGPTGTPWPIETPLPPGVTVFDLQHRVLNGRFPLDVRLFDETGLVTSLEDYPLGRVGGTGIRGAAPPDQGIVFYDTLGTCVDRLVFVLRNRGDGTLSLRPSLAAISDPCFHPMSLLGRSILIRLREPVALDRIQLLPLEDTSERG